MTESVLTEKMFCEWLRDNWNRRRPTVEEIEDYISATYPNLIKGSKAFKEAVIRCPLSWSN